MWFKQMWFKVIDEDTIDAHDANDDAGVDADVDALNPMTPTLRKCKCIFTYSTHAPVKQSKQISHHSNDK